MQQRSTRKCAVLKTACGRLSLRMFLLPGRVQGVAQEQDHHTYLHPGDRQEQGCQRAIDGGFPEQGHEPGKEFRENEPSQGSKDCPGDLFLQRLLSARQQGVEYQDQKNSGGSGKKSVAAEPVTAKRSAPKKLSYMEDRELKQLEDRIPELEDSIAGIEAKFSDPAGMSAAEMQTLTAELDEKRAELEKMYARWEELAAKLEALTQG